MSKKGRPRKYKVGYVASIYMDLELIKIIQEKAQEQHKSISEYINDVLWEHVGKEKQDSKNQ
ncbi:MAG: hypothetical protein JHC26_04915 [Thermofilum sp.]|jgi:hypothetical protein|uniref:hypothetical protein n=1 Tax=Thermofilum sp. TaxID=1961369 RepID=UPI00259099D6|nr:hypothetical protein [Thermofilum sp.]MCI4408410.1 hypothetical protein [Thermofilum sp.]